MKKILSILLVSVMSIALCFAMTSCNDGEHMHMFDNTWASDATHHWHPCTREGCGFKMEGFASHSWDDGVTEGENVKYTCTVCGATSNEPAVAEPSLTEEEWNAAMAEVSFENYTLKQSGTVTYHDVEEMGVVDTSCNIRITKEKFAVQIKLDGEEVGTMVYGGEHAIQQKKSYEEVFRALLNDYENFEYDAEQMVFVNKGTVSTTVSIEQQGVTAHVTMTSGKATFDDRGRLVFFECEYSQTTSLPNGESVLITSNINWEFSNYGTTVIDEEPNVDEH